MEKPVEKDTMPDDISSDTESKKQDLVCDECMRPFASLSKLNRHRKEQHAETLPKFECRSCDKCFTRREHLKRHERACHLGDKIQCPLCSSRFIEKCRLMKHLLEKHEVYKCSKCSAVIKTRTPEVHVCGSGFAFPEAEYGCKFCEKKYRRKGYLIKHLESYHGRKADRFKDVVAELQRLETPLASVSKSLCSELYEYEIGVEYDIKDETGATTGKRDIFSGLINLPKIMAYAGSKNLIFGKLEIGPRPTAALMDDPFKSNVVQNVTPKALLSDN
jgi:Zinc finger, C2H2 type